MNAFLVRRPILLGLVVFGLAWIVFAWISSAPDSDRHKPDPHPGRASGPGKTAGNRTGAPRSANGIIKDVEHDVSADGRPPDARREAIIRMGLGEIQEMQQMNKAVFDEAAKRWNAQPRVKELIARWKDAEATWKTQDDEAKAAVVPQMEATWKEAIGLLREEVEKSAREADAGVK